MLFAAAVVASVFVGAVPGRAAGFTAFSMTPSSGPAGATVHVSGGGCSPGLVVLPGEDYVELAATSLIPSTVHIPVAANGSWSGTFTVNALAVPGPVAVAPVCVTNNIPSLGTLYSPQLFTVTAPAQAPPAPTTTTPASGSSGPTTTAAPGSGSGGGGGNSGGGGGNGSGGNGSGGGTTIPSSVPGTGSGTGPGGGSGSGGGATAGGSGGQGGGTSGASTGGVGVAGAKPGTSGALDGAGLLSAQTNSRAPSHSGGSVAGPIWLLLAGLALLTLLAWADWKRRRRALEEDPEVA